LDDFYRKMRKTGRHCDERSEEAIHIYQYFGNSGLLRRLRRLAMTMRV
jgi:hypothetical protein